MAFFPKQSGTTEQSFQIGAGNGKSTQTLDATNLTSNRTWKFPDSDGSSGYNLSTDGAGNLAWASPGAATDQTTPYNIPSGITYTVNVDKQALYAEDILIEGNLVVEGDLLDTRVTIPPTANTSITLTGNVTGSGVTGTSINTVIPILTANNFSNLGNPINNGSDGSLAIGFGAQLGETFTSALFKQYMTIVGTNSYGAFEGATVFGANARSEQSHGTAIGFQATAAGAGGSYNQTALGISATATGSGSFAMGEFCQAFSDGSIAIGSGAGAFATKAITLGQYINNICPGSLITGGHGQSSNTEFITLYKVTTSSTPIRMVTTSPENGDIIQNADTTMLYRCQFVATDNTDYYSVSYDFVISSDSSGTLTIRGTPIKTILVQTGGATAWDINISVPYANAPQLEVTGGSTTIRWSGTMIATILKTI